MAPQRGFVTTAMRVAFRPASNGGHATMSGGCSGCPCVGHGGATDPLGPDLIKIKTGAGAICYSPGYARFFYFLHPPGA